VHFATLQFIYFLAVVVTVAWVLRRHRTAHKVFLLAASYFFYGRLNFSLMTLLVVSSLLNWALGEIAFYAARPGVRKTALVVALVSNLGVLALYKYYGFFTQIVGDVARGLELESHLPILELALPLGISFFTFQGIAYVVDLYRGRGTRAESALDFLLFIAFFPKLLAGPICRSKELLPQIASGPPPLVPDLSRATTLIASGFFKKMVLATVLSTRLVDDAFIAPENYSGSALLLAAYAYSIELYCDFSGYTDVARGVALLLGYRLPENFKAPYAATDPGLFWRRWHATFSSWLRDYVYFPLGGSKRGLARTLLNLLLTFTISGLWHGASWGYVLWGFLHGLALCVHKLVREWRKAAGWLGREPYWWLGIGWLLTFNFVVFSRICFRTGDLQTAGVFIERMLSGIGEGASADGWVIIATVAGLALNFVGAPARAMMIRLQERMPMPLRPVYWTALAMLILAVKPGDVAPYIYFQF
jgi:D-alanyl-lipoteichoic acid acyltransferase DltB (MBOAT superfamily)